MNDILVIDKGIALTKIAKVRHNKIQSLFVNNHFNESRQDQIYIGQVIDIVKNLKAVFIDYGTDKKGMLHLKDIPKIYQKINIGMRLPVQVVKEQHGDKGDRLTGFITFTGAYFVCLVAEQDVAISKKIDDMQIRDKLYNLISQRTNKKIGFIVRTEAQFADEKKLQAELQYLTNKAENLRNTYLSLAKGTHFKSENVSYSKWLVNQKFTSNEITILCNNAVELEEVLKFINSSMPYLTVNKTLYEPTTSVFNLIGVGKDFQECVSPKIWLKNGGNIVIEHTEAMTIIDVNSAKAVIKKNPKQSILQLNKLAIEETIFQCIKRNLAGIIILDLVEIEDIETKELLYDYAKEVILKYDKKRMNCYKITEIGLLQFTRSRSYKPLNECLLETFYHMGLRQQIPNLGYILYQIEDKLRPILEQNSHKYIKINVNNKLNDFFSQNDIVDKFKEVYNIEILVSQANDLGNLSYKINYH